MAKPLSQDQTVLIIGASHAGVSMAEQLRKNGFGGMVVLMDRETTQPMERPPLSKAWLTERAKADDSRFLLRQPAWFDEHDVDFRSGVEVVAIDAERRIVRCADGAELGWDGLVLATGAVPRRLPVPGGDDASVFVLRVPADAARLSSALDKAARLAVVGGGYIGLEVAASARKRGLEVAVLEMAPRLLARVASPEASAFFEDLHRGQGVRVATGASLEAIERDGAALRLLAGAEEIAADAVLAGIGVVPDTALAEGADLAVGNGFAVDARYRTQVDGIYAIGDAALPDGGYTGGALRIESVHHAQMSAEIAAAAMMGIEAKAHEVPWFWSDQYDAKLQSAGIVPQGAETVTRPGRREGARSFWSFQDGALKAVEAVNDAQAYMVGRTVMEKGIPLAPEQVADGGFDLKALIRA